MVGPQSLYLFFVVSVDFRDRAPRNLCVCLLLGQLRFELHDAVAISSCVHPAVAWFAFEDGIVNVAIVAMLDAVGGGQNITTFLACRRCRSVHVALHSDWLGDDESRFQP